MAVADSSAKRARSLLPILPIVLGFLVVAIAYSVVVPILEAPDEPSHVSFVRYLVANASLPDQRPQFGYPVGQEGSQPPLYYALGSLLWRLSPGPDLTPPWSAHNPFVTFARSTDPPGNRAFYAHTAAESFPYRGDILGIHLVRWLSVALGLLTVVSTYAIARELFPGRWSVAPLAAGIVAFDPQFAFISGMVNNDNAIAAASSVVLYALTRWWKRGGSRGLAIALGTAIGAAILSKTEGILLVVPVAIVLVGDQARRRDKSEWVNVAVVAVVAALLSGWWFARNQLLYGDPIGWSAMLRANGGMLRPAPLDPIAALVVLWQARGTFWGAFGWTNVLFPVAVYRAVDVALAVGGVGLVVSARRINWQRRWESWVLPTTFLAVWPALVAASLVRWIQVNEAADQWRLLFSAISPIAILLALGIAEIGATAAVARRVWSPRPLGDGQGEGVPGPSFSPTFPAILAVLIAVGGVAVNAVVLERVVAPRYYPTVAPASAVGAGPLIRFGSDVELVQYQVSPARIAPGGAVDVDLLWRAQATPTRNWAVSLTMTGPSGTPIALEQSWPQAGSAPTTAWIPGQLYRDHYRLTPVWQSDEPDLAPVWLSLYDASTVQTTNLPVTDSNGHDAGTGFALDRVKLAPSQVGPPVPSHPVDVGFGPSIRLVGYDVGEASDDLEVTLYWRDEAPVATSYTVFVHLTDAAGKLVAQHDGPPRVGRYPTDAWAPGETIRDIHVVTVGALPAGHYAVQVGMYDPRTGGRLAVTARPEVIASADAVLLVGWDKS